MPGVVYIPGVLFYHKPRLFPVFKLLHHSLRTYYSTSDGLALLLRFNDGECRGQYDYTEHCRHHNTTL